MNMSNIRVNIQKKDGFERLDNLLKYLDIIGVQISDIEYPKTSQLGSVQVTIEIPCKEKIELMQRNKTRNAGRKPVIITPRSGSEIKKRTTCGEFLEWLESHSSDEAMYELQLKRATYFKKLKEIKKPENINRPLDLI